MLRHSGNYEPFEDFFPDPRRLDKYRLSGKITDQTWLEYRSILTSGFSRVWEDVKAKRKFVEEEREAAMLKETEERAKRLRSQLVPFPFYELVQFWLAEHLVETSRYSCLLILGPSFTGKTEYGLSLFKRGLCLQIGPLEFFPDGMRRFDTTVDGLVLDDVRDLNFLSRNQDILQSKNAPVEFGQSMTGRDSYRRNLHATPIVLTTNFTCKNLQFLVEDDYCSKSSNVKVMRFPPPLIAQACRLPPFGFPPQFDPQLATALETRFDM